VQSLPAHKLMSCYTY